jgi:alpha-N-arabinofuranosidase
VVNPNLHQSLSTEIALPGMAIASVSGTVLTGPDVHAHNDFDHPDAVATTPAKTGIPVSGRLLHSFPAASVTALTLTLS